MTEKSMQLLKYYLPALGGVLAALVFFAAALFLSSPDQMGAMVRYGFGFWLVVLGLLFLLVYHSHGNRLIAVLVLLFCSLSLAGLWVNKSNDLQVLSGFVFFSDAAQYYADGLRLLEGFPMSSFSGRHPLPAIFWGTLLWLMKGNLQFTLIVLAIIVSFCIIAAGNIIARFVNPVAAALWITLLLLFYRRFTGLLNSEQMGIAFGCLSLMFLLQAAVTKNTRAGLSGLLFLGLAIAARPGAFLILVFALIWVTYNVPVFPRKWFVNLCIGLSTVSLGFALTLLSNFMLAEKGTVAYSNYAYSLYGMFFGDLGWEQFASDHPDVSGLSSPQAEAVAFRVTLKAIQADPMPGLRGWGNSLLGYFTVGPESLYGFVSSGETASLGRPESASSKWIYTVVRLSLYVLTILGMWTLWRGRACLTYSLLFWSGVATLLGISIIPARDAGMMRIHAASVPYLLCLPSMGLGSLFPGHLVADGKILARNPFHVFAYGLLVILLAGIPLFAMFHQKRDFSNVESQCGAGQVSAVVRMDSGSYIKIVEDGSTIPLGYPIMHYSEFLERVNGFYRAGLLTDLAQIPPDTMLSHFLDLRTGQSGWLILPLAENPASGNVMEVCGRWQPDLLAKGLGFLQAEQTHFISSH